MRGPSTQRLRVRGLSTGLLRRLSELDVERLSDWRSARGSKLRSSVAGILFALLLSVLTGRRSQRGCEELTWLISPRMRKLLRLPYAISDSVLGRSLPRFDFESVRSLLHGQIKQALHRGHLRPEPGLPHVLAIDGKHLPPVEDLNHSSVQAHHPQKQAAYGLVRVLNVTHVSAKRPVCVDAFVIPGATNEIGVAADALDALFDAYRSTQMLELVMSDAGNASARTATTIDERGCGYALRLSEMQGGIWADGLAALRNAPCVAEHRERARGCEVHYRLFLSTIECPERYGWGHARLWLRLERTTTDAYGTRKQGTRDWASNVPLTTYQPAIWIRILRKYWQVEEMHCSLDLAWFEDRRRSLLTKSPNGLLVRALLMRIAYNAIEILKLLRGANPHNFTTRDIFEQIQLALMLGDDTGACAESC